MIIDKYSLKVQIKSGTEDLGFYRIQLVYAFFKVEGSILPSSKVACLLNHFVARRANRIMRGSARTTITTVRSSITGNDNRGATAAPRFLVDIPMLRIIL